MIYLFYLVISFVFVYLSGHLILWVSNLRISKDYARLFAKLVLGLFALVTVYSIVKTTFVTINTALLLLAVLYGVVLRKKVQFYRIAGWDSFVSLKDDFVGFRDSLLVLIVLFAWGYFKVYSSVNDYPIVINWDSITDIMRAMYLNYSGVETGDMNYIQIPNGVQPYHYFESWCVAFFGFLFRENYWLTQQMIVFPLVLTMIVVGFWAIMENFILSNSHKVFALLILFISGFYFSDLGDITFFKWTVAFANNVFDEPWMNRLSIVYLVILSSILFLINKQQLLGVLTLLSLPILTITLAPTILTVSFLIIFIGLWKRSTYRFALGDLLYPISVFLYIVGFYAVFQDKQAFIATPTPDVLIGQFDEWSKIRTTVIIAIEKLIQAGLLYLPHILLVLLAVVASVRKGRILKVIPSFLKLQITITVLVLIMSLCFWRLFEFVFGSSFFFYYAAVPFINVLFAVLIYWVLVKVRKKVFIWVYVVLALTFYVNRSYRVYDLSKRVTFEEKYSGTFLNEVAAELQGINNKIGVKLESHEEIVHPMFNEGLTLCGLYLYGMLDEFAMTSLSRADIPKEQLTTESALNFTKHAPFYRFVSEQKKNSEYKSIAQSKLDFILTYNVEFMVLTPKGRVDSILLPLVKKTISDELSLEKFILLKKQGD